MKQPRNAIFKLSKRVELLELSNLLSLLSAAGQTVTSNTCVLTVQCSCRSDRPTSRAPCSNGLLMRSCLWPITRRDSWRPFGSSAVPLCLWGRWPGPDLIPQPLECRPQIVITGHRGALSDASGNFPAPADERWTQSFNDV